MSLIESYDLTAGGLHPVLVRDSWQVTTLNYSEKYHLENINCLIKHQMSDKAVSLLIGDAVLLVCQDNQLTDFKAVQMKRGTSYNIPKNVAYTIAMYKGSQLFIVEKPNTHCDDSIECSLTGIQLAEIKRNINQELNNNGQQNSTHLEQ